MTKAEYEEIQERLKKKLKDNKYLSGRKSSEYKEGILSAISIVRDVYRKGLENDRFQ